MVLSGLLTLIACALAVTAAYIPVSYCHYLVLHLYSVVSGETPKPVLGYGLFFVHGTQQCCTDICVDLSLYWEDRC